MYVHSFYYLRSLWMNRLLFFCYHNFTTRRRWQIKCARMYQKSMIVIKWENNKKRKTESNAHNLIFLFLKPFSPLSPQLSFTMRKQNIGIGVIHSIKRKFKIDDGKLQENQIERNIFTHFFRLLHLDHSLEVFFLQLWHQNISSTCKCWSNQPHIHLFNFID